MPSLAWLRDKGAKFLQQGRACEEFRNAIPITPDFLTHLAIASGGDFKMNQQGKRILHLELTDHATAAIELLTVVEQIGNHTFVELLKRIPKAAGHVLVTTVAQNAVQNRWMKVSPNDVAELKDYVYSLRPDVKYLDDELESIVEGKTAFFLIRPNSVETVPKPPAAENVEGTSTAKIGPRKLLRTGGRGIPDQQLSKAASIVNLGEGVDGTESEAAELPIALALHSSVVHDGFGYVFGGQTGEGPGGVSARCFRYDFTADRWSEMEDLPAPRYQAKAISFGKWILLFCGLGEDGKPTDTVFALDPKDTEVGVWKLVTQLFHGPRHNFDVAVMGDTVFLTGGIVDGVPTNTCMTLSQVDGHWMWDGARELSSPRAEHQMDAGHAHICLFGGVDDKGKELKTVETLRPTSKMWERAKTTLPDSLVRAVRVAG